MKRHFDQDRINLNTSFWQIGVLGSLMLGALIITAQPIIAQESQILEAIRNGTIKSSLADSIPGSEAEEIGGAIATNLGYLVEVTRQQEKDITDKAFPLMSAKWPFNTVYVCWENSSDQFADEMALVEQAVSNSWELSSGLTFKGWGSCQPTSAGIRIKIEDTGPKVERLGKYLNGVKNGMKLNFVYDNWSPSCKTMLDFCNKSIAVHEFGHAIGFSHEQNRSDTPSDCFDEPQGQDGDTLLTPWDPKSVMNYCNPKYANGGKLSDLDIVAVQYIYGR